MVFFVKFSLLRFSIILLCCTISNAFLKSIANKYHFFSFLIFISFISASVWIICICVVCYFWYAIYYLNLTLSCNSFRISASIIFMITFMVPIGLSYYRFGIPFILFKIINLIVISSFSIYLVVKIWLIIYVIISSIYLLFLESRLSIRLSAI